MGVKYLKDFEFPSAGGFHGSNKMPSKVGKATGAPRMASMPKVGKGQGYADGGMTSAPLSVRGNEPVSVISVKPMTKGQMALKETMARQEARKAKLAEDFARRKAEQRAKISAREAASAARKAPPVVAGGLADSTMPAPGMRPNASVQPYAKGGKAKISKVMREYKEGKLHSGSKKGPKVESRKQAVAIALSEARKAGAKIPKKAEGGIFNDEDMAYESKGPKTRYSAARSRREAKKRAMERRALDKARHAEKYAPGLSLDMADKKKHGGMPVHRRKPMYGNG